MSNKRFLAFAVLWIIYVGAMTYGMDKMNPATFVRVIVWTHPVLYLMAIWHLITTSKNKN